MKTLFIGAFQGPGNATGEEPDERHMSRCLKQTGTVVTEVPRDEIHANFVGAKKDNLPEGEFDFIILTKWAHYTAEMIDMVREKYKGKIVYWTWDFMFAPHRDWWTPDWHKMLLEKTDYYISGELGMSSWFKENNVKHIYFNWDTADGQYDQLERNEDIDVAFTGTYIPHSYRNDMLRTIKDRFNLKVFSFDFEKWKEEGFDAEPGKYGADYNQITARSKVVLCMNWVEPRDESIGYWSNRVGKVMTTGGLPLVHYVRGMERQLSDSPFYFHDEADMVNKLEWLLGNHKQRETARVKAYDFGRARMTTQKRMQEFKILLESL